jgi:catechol 2,3-dioxygenase-like lactoylglutathione lyase family enzyme
MKQHIVGIQQVGVGIPDVQKAWEFYRKNFGMDIPIFQESAEAKLMTPYTGGTIHARSAVLAINLLGGSGLEIWQYTSRTPQAPKFDIQLGDLGIFVTKIKSPDVENAWRVIKSKKEKVSELMKGPDGEPHFFVTDTYGNVFQVVKGVDWFRKREKHATGGVCGASIGVTDINRSIKFYSEILGYDKIVYDKEGTFDDLTPIAGGKGKFRRVLLTRKVNNPGNFSRLLGSGQIELFQPLDRTPKKIFENRYWGDLGFIHLCFDVNDMKGLGEKLKSNGHPFTVDSASSFDMGEAAGHFSYSEDPDGTLIEFVETHRIPILKAIGWYLDVSKRDRTKALPNWMLNTLKLTRVKEPS